MEFFLDPTSRHSALNFEESASLLLSHAPSQRKELESINCGLTKKQLKEFVLYQPALLAYSLETRLKPRIRRMQEHSILFLYSPKGIMSFTNDKFDNWYVDSSDHLEGTGLKLSLRDIYFASYYFFTLSYRISTQVTTWSISG